MAGSRGDVYHARGLLLWPLAWLRAGLRVCFISLPFVGSSFVLLRNSFFRVGGS